MSNDLKISRELLETISHNLTRASLERKVCALLAAPVVERQSEVIDLDAVDWETIQKAADESNWMPNEYMRNEWVADVCNFLKYGRTEHPATPELAELQATIARLTAENERPNKQLCVCPSCHGQGEIYSGHDSYQGQWQPPEPDMDKCGECDGDGVIGTPIDLAAALAEIERLKGGQGEPVAWEYLNTGMGNQLQYQRRDHYWLNPGAVDEHDYIKGTPLYRSQPAPLSVQHNLQMADVVRAHMEIPGCPVLTSNQCHALAVKLNACLDKVKELNQ